MHYISLLKGVQQLYKYDLEKYRILQEKKTFRSYGNTIKLLATGLSLPSEGLLRI